MSDAPDLDPRPARPRGRLKRRITLGLATILAVAALALGLALGWIARGGPPERVLVTTNQEIPVVTVTVPAQPVP